MSSSSPSSGPIKRFTYDWLIRFCELHPTDPSYFTLVDTKTRQKTPKKQCYINQSKFINISPMFLTLIKRYMPLIIECCNELTIYGRKLHDIVVPADNKKIVVLTGSIEFNKIKRKRIIHFVKVQRIYFNMQKVVLIDCTIQPNELRHLLIRCQTIEGSATLSAPMCYSDIWPHLTHCTLFDLNCPDLIWDNDNMTELMSSNAYKAPQTLKLHNLRFDESVFPLVQNFAKSSFVKEVHLSFDASIGNTTCSSMVHGIINVYENAGRSLDHIILPFYRSQNTIVVEGGLHISIYVSKNLWRKNQQ